MDLLKLGSQARKTGLKPRSDIAKDKYDMEDIDEFFEDTTWSESKKKTDLAGDPTGSLQKKRSSLADKVPNKRKTLGLGRIRRVKNSNEQVLPLLTSTAEIKDSIENNKNEIEQDYPEFVDLNDFDVDEEREYNESFANQNPIKENGVKSSDGDPSQSDIAQGKESDHMAAENSDKARIDDESQSRHELLNNDILRDLDNDMTLSPIPLLSLKDRSEALGGQEIYAVIENSKKSKGAFTKNMALSLTTKRKRPRIYESDEGEQGSANKDQENLSSDGADVFDSDFPESEVSQGSSNKPTQTGAYQNSPLPSPPPEGLRRSKRTKIAPLAYWRNERIVYSRAQTSATNPDNTLISDIRKVPLQEIREVVHIPESVRKKTASRPGRPPKNASTAARGRKPKARPVDYDYESDPEIEGSEWFRNKLIEAEVFDSEFSRVKRVVAWSPDGGDFKSGQLEMGNFKIATLFDSDSGAVGAGLLEFPIDGFKASQTTGNSLFIFHVAKGLVKVTLSSDTFIVTRGCSFEIPKKNIYDFKNIGRSAARLFFVQCHLA